MSTFSYAKPRSIKRFFEYDRNLIQELVITFKEYDDAILFFFLLIKQFAKCSKEEKHARQVCMLICPSQTNSIDK